jgi:hypothetical protein
MLKRLAALVLLAAAVVGCGQQTYTVSNPVPAKGKVTLANGAPVKDVQLVLQPTGGGGMPTGAKVGPDGSFSTEVVPGKYAYYFIAIPDAKSAGEKQKSEAALKAIPAKYHEAHMDRQISVSGDFDLKLDAN